MKTILFFPCAALLFLLTQNCYCQKKNTHDRHIVVIDCFDKSMDNEGTNDMITVSFWSNNKLLSYSSKNAINIGVGGKQAYGVRDISSPKCSNTSMCGYFAPEKFTEELTHVVVQTDGDDGFWMDKVMVYEPKGEEPLRTWGVKGGKGYCLSSDSEDGMRSWKDKASGCHQAIVFNLKDGSWNGGKISSYVISGQAKTVNEVILDAGDILYDGTVDAFNWGEETKEKADQAISDAIWKTIDGVETVYTDDEFAYRVVVDCYDETMEHEGTKNKITVELYSGTEQIGKTISKVPKCGEDKKTFFPFGGTNLKPTHVIIKTDGDDGFWMDYVRLARSPSIDIKGYKKWKQWGVNGSNGYCMSTDAEDGEGSWKNRVSGCYPAISFDVSTGKYKGIR